jgi:uncharacterized protein YecE (DUF72 family)
MTGLKIGTCSWNYDSWVGLVYTQPQTKSAAYLQEYSQKYRTVEIDSWFYRIPSNQDVLLYKSFVDPEFSFACKVPEEITLTHKRARGGDKKTLTANPTFLDPERFAEFIEAIRPLLPQIDVIELEFEYLNKEKMPSFDLFLKYLSAFLSEIEPGLPLAIEPRNASYLNEEYFAFLKEKRVAHVFSEKIYMPHIYEVYEKYSSLLTGLSVIRLLGGDRKEIEAKTKEQWNQLVDEKPDLPQVVDMLRDMRTKGFTIQLYVNNHYEGAAPKTINKIQQLLI